MEIVLLESLATDPKQIDTFKNKLEAMGHHLSVYEKSEDVDTLKKEVQDADAIILANMPLPWQAIEGADHLKYIDVAFTGVDHIPVAQAKEKGILISNASGYANDAVAELSLALMIDLLRKIPQVEKACREGKTKAGLVGNLLKNKKVGIIGTGQIGLSVAKLLKAFGATTIGYCRHPFESEWIDEWKNLEELLAESDLITLHTPLTDQTRHLISADEFRKMKKTAYLINTARGPVVDIQALIRALNTHEIAGAAIDVFDQEPPLNPQDPLFAADHLIVTPHIGFASAESMEERAEIVFDNLFSWLEGKPKNLIH